MGKHERSNDGFYSKIVIAGIVVVWVSLVGGNWLGHYIVEKGVLGKSKKQDYAPSRQQKPKPWITVDPAQQQELERLQNGSDSFFRRDRPATTPSPNASSPTPGPESSPAQAPDVPLVTASPVEVIEPAPTPVQARDNLEDRAPLPTPAEVSSGTYYLQFGSFNSRENATSMVDSLAAIGQEASVEEIETTNGKKVFRVRGGTYSEEQARQQRDKLQDQNIQAFIVNSQ